MKLTRDKIVRLEQLGIGTYDKLLELSQDPDRMHRVAQGIGVDTPTLSSWVVGVSKIRGEKPLAPAFGPGLSEDTHGIWERHFAMRAAALADERISRRENRWRALVSGVVVVAIAAGAFSIRDLRDDITQRAVDAKEQNRLHLAGLIPDITKKAAEEASVHIFNGFDKKNSAKIAEFDTQIEEQYTKLDRTVQWHFALVSTTEMAERIERDSFKNSDRDQIMENLDFIQAGKSNFKLPAGFEATLSKIVESFYRADLRDQVDKIARWFPKQAAKNAFALVLVQSYGQIAIGQSWSDKNSIAGLKLAIAALKKSSYPEVALIYQTGMAQRSSKSALGQWGGSTQELLETAKSLSRSDLRNFLSILKTSSSLGSLVKDPDTAEPYMKKFANTFAEVRVQYADQIAELKELAGK